MKITPNETKMILQRFNRNYIDKCILLEMYENNKTKDEMMAFIKHAMSKIPKTFPDKHMRLQTNTNIEYYISYTEEALKLKKVDLLNERSDYFSLAWEICVSLVIQLMQKDMFFTEQEKMTRIFSMLLIEKYQGKNSISISLSKSKKEAIKQIVDYFRNVYDLCTKSNSLIKYNQKYNIKTIEEFKNRLLFDKKYTYGLRKHLKYEFEIIPLYQNKIEYIKKLIPAAIFVEDIGIIRKKLYVIKFIGDEVVYQNQAYKIVDIEDNHLIIENIENNQKHINVMYRQLLNMQKNKMAIIS